MWRRNENSNGGNNQYRKYAKINESEMAAKWRNGEEMKAKIFSKMAMVISHRKPYQWRRNESGINMNEVNESS
jgi:hypothetical protein